MATRTRIGILAWAALTAAAPAGAAPKEPDWALLEKQFRELPMEAKRLTGPLFWLHGDESAAQLEKELEKVAEGGNGSFTAESRPHKDWLGPGWYRDLDICLQAAKRFNLEMWIFDEKWWPSQMLGGKVPPEYGSKTMVAEALAVEGPKAVREAGYGGRELIGTVAGREAEGGIDGASLVDLAPHIRDGALAWDAPAGKWKVMKFTWKFTGPKGMQQKMIAVDGASRECVDWFLKTVYQPHYDRFKDDFGKTIRGYFYDEPETLGDWGPEVMRLLAERKVDWKKAMVAWKYALAGEEQVAAKYQYADAFAEAWGRTMYGGMATWCREHKVVSMGHFMEHGSDLFSRQLCAGNMFQLQKYSDMGGIDLVCQQFYPGEKKHGLWQMAKLGSSISHVYNKADDIAMCEMFGAYGQHITYPQMKWLTDQMQVRGVNFMIPHSFNPRAPFDGDCPPYFYNGGFEPRYALYRIYADYTSRLSLLLAGGRHVAPVALLFLGQSIHAGRSVRPDDLTNALDDGLFDSDWVPYDAFEDDARLDGGEVRLHKEGYRVLVVPPTEVIPHGTLAKAKAFFDQGGVVVGYGFLPSKSATLGKTAADIAALRDAVWGDAKPGLATCKTSPAGGKSYLLPEKPTPEQLQQVLAGDAGVHPALEVLQGETSHWLHVLHRVKAGRDVFLVCNQNHQGAARPFRFKVTAVGEPECWDPMRNEVTAVPFRRTGEKTVEIDLTLQPSESVLLVFQPQKRALPPRIGDDAKPAREPVAVVRDTSIVDPEPELPGSKAKPSLSGGSWIWLEANAAAAAPPGTRYFRKSVALPADRKVKSARFVLSADNEFVLFVNGQKAGEGSEWSRPEEIDVARLLKPGENLFAIAAINGTDKANPAGLIGRCEVRYESGEPLVVVTDAAWRASDREQAGWEKPGFDDKAWPQAKVAAAFGQGPWGNLSAGGGGRATLSPVKADIFHGKCALPAGIDLAKARVCLEMDELAPEEAARVTVNGASAGGFIGRPFRLDVTKLLKPGENRIDIAPFAPKTARLAFYER